MLDNTQVDLQRIAFEQSSRDIEQSSRCLLAAFAYLGLPKTFLDIGCGPGHLPKLAARLGVTSMGVDLYVEPFDDLLCCLLRVDITDDNLGYIERDSELVVCWEVAEHIERRYANRLCDIIARHTLNTLLFSAAVEGQGGSGHVNERTHQYWADKFQRRGLEVDSMLTTNLRRVFRQVAAPAWWYGQNLLVMKRR